MPPAWLLVDGSSLIFRAFFGVPKSVRAPDGRLVNGVRGSLERLTRLVNDRRPEHIAVADDADWRPAWRVELIPEYKAHRVAEPVPPELIPQLPLFRELLEAIGVDFVAAPDYEAEDVIAAWTAQAEGRIEIASGDRDLFALVEDPRVSVLYPERTGTAVIDEAEVTRRYGVPGRRYADFAVLRGDPSDGLPGLRGVGAVAAAGLIHKHGDIAGVIRDASLNDTARDYLGRAMRVVTPMRALDIPLPAGRRDTYPANRGRLESLSSALGIVTAATRLVDALSARLAVGGS